MILPFFIKKQQEALIQYVAEIAQRKVAINAPSVAGCRDALENANESYNTYTLLTKRMMGKLKSIIPFTQAFEARLICARRISTAYKLLAQVDKNIAALEAAKGALRENDKAVKRSRSDEVMPTVYPSPIARRRNSLSGDNVGHRKSLNFAVGYKL